MPADIEGAGPPTIRRILCQTGQRRAASLRPVRVRPRAAVLALPCVVTYLQMNALRSYRGDYDYQQPRLQSTRR